VAVGEARRRKLEVVAARAAREESPEELAQPVLGDLRKAHMPSATTLVEARVRDAIRNLLGDKVRARKNFETWETPGAGVLTPDLVWAMVEHEIVRLDVLDADKRELRKVWRTRKWTWFGDVTLEEMNVRLGGMPHTMAGSYYGED
jgi:hypothetical protein